MPSVKAFDTHVKFLQQAGRLVQKLHVRAERPAAETMTTHKENFPRKKGYALFLCTSMARYTRAPSGACDSAGPSADSAGPTRVSTQLPSSNVFCTVIVRIDRVLAGLELTAVGVGVGARRRLSSRRAGSGSGGSDGGDEQQCDGALRHRHRSNDA